MSTRVVIRVVADIGLAQLIGSVTQRPENFRGKAELVVADVKLDRFSPDLLDVELEPLLRRGLAALDEKGHKDLLKCKLEVSIHLSSDDDGVRPSLHLTQSVIRQLAAVGASVDFDPYCS